MYMYSKTCHFVRFEMARNNLVSIQYFVWQSDERMARVNAFRLI